jgi:hypothetical protein
VSLVGLVLALAGLVPAFGMFIQSIDRRGRPGRWFVTTLLLYGLSILVVLSGAP